MLVRIVNSYMSNSDGVVECEVTRVVNGKTCIQALPPIRIPKSLIADDETFKIAVVKAVEHMTSNERDISRFVGMEFKL